VCHDCKHTLVHLHAAAAVARHVHRRRAHVVVVLAPDGASLLHRPYFPIVSCSFCGICFRHFCGAHAGMLVRTCLCIRAYTIDNYFIYLLLACKVLLVLNARCWVVYVRVDSLQEHREMSRPGALNPG